MKKLSLFINKYSLLLVLVLPLLAIAQEQTKIAYLEETKVLKSLDNYQEQVKELDSLSKSYSKDVADKNRKLEEKLKTLLSNYEFKGEQTLESIKEKLNDQDKERYSFYLEEYKQIEEYSKSYENILQIKYKQNIQPMLDMVNGVVNQYAKSNKIMIVHKLEGLNVAYLDESMNITEDILKELKKK